MLFGLIGNNKEEKKEEGIKGAEEKKAVKKAKKTSGKSEDGESSDKSPASQNAGQNVSEEEKHPKADTPMGELLAETKNPPKLGDVVEGPVIIIEKASVFVDLAPFGTGIIYGREYLNARDLIRKMNVGDIIAAKIVDTENKEGYIELSLKEARQALIWSEAEVIIREKRTLELAVKDANKGGLILEWQGIQGFLPASQLKPDHYPRVEDGDKDRIYEELKKLVGTPLSVTIIGATPKEGKLIFSEKSSAQKEKHEMLSKYEIGDLVEGTITGIVDFGLFVKIEDDLEGLIHISEVDWKLVEALRSLFKVSDKVSAKIIEIKDGKISLSLKALRKNPWLDAEKKYKKDQEVEAVVIKYNKHGALASIEEGVAGLVHLSEFESEAKLKATLELGKSYKFKIASFDPKEQKMTLAWSGDSKKK